MRVAIALRGCAQKDLAAAMGITPASLSQKFVGKTLWNLVDIEKASQPSISPIVWTCRKTC